MAVIWRVYYGDGSTYSNEDGSWDSAPGRRVVCVAMIDPTGVWGRFVRNKHEFYYKADGRDEVLGSETLAAVQEHVPGIRDTQIKAGGNVWTEEFINIMIAATQDTDFPTSSPRRRASDFI